MAITETKHRKEYLKNYKSANYDGIIYNIINPIGEIYIGSTKCKSNVRFSQHKREYRRQYKNGFSKFPLLHNSFTSFGIDAHTFKVIMECGNISRKELRKIESDMIISLKLSGKCLNVNN
jgi:hypothetical protein